MRDGELAELRQPDFPIVMRGYDRAAVDAYVERANQAIADLQVGRSPQSAIRHALDQVGEETRGILERAHDTADEITGRSQAQAAERVDLAAREARELIAAAEARVRVLDADADEVWHERKRLIDDVERVSAELAELAEAASRRFPAETPESAADTARIDAPEEEFGAADDDGVSDTAESALPEPPEGDPLDPPPGRSADTPPPPPPAAAPPPPGGRQEGDAAA